MLAKDHFLVSFECTIAWWGQNLYEGAAFIIHIFKNLLPDESCDINEFKNYFLVNKEWNKLFNSNQMKITLKKKILVLAYIKFFSIEDGKISERTFIVVPTS